MAIIRKFSTLILNPENISDINKILVQYTDSTTQHSSHIVFNNKPINTFEINLDLSFFRLCGEDEKSLKNKIDLIIAKLDQLDIDYSIKDEDTGKIYTSIGAAGAIEIKFDNIKFIPEGTYAQIDALKNIKTEFGYCKGYKPSYHPIESKENENLIINPETIYIFSRTRENEIKLKNCLSEKIMEINPDFIISFKEYIGNFSKYVELD